VTKWLFNFAGVTKDDAKDCVALGITIGLMLFGVCLVALPVVLLLRWLLMPDWIPSLVIMVVSWFGGYVLGRLTRHKPLGKLADNSEWG
jgi:hypothetical protein